MSLAAPTPRPCRGPRALFQLMARQHGVASRAQVRAAGVSRAVEQRLVDEGALIRLIPGVVAAGGVALTFGAQAMAATLRPGVLGVSHGAAARLHRLGGFEQHPHIDVIGPRGAHIRVEPPIFARYSRGPVERQIVRVGAIAVTSIPLTLTLITPEVTRDEAVAALADALRRGVPANAIRAVAEQWREPGRPGPARLLRLLDQVSDGTRATPPIGRRHLSVIR